MFLANLCSVGVPTDIPVEWIINRLSPNKLLAFCIRTGSLQTGEPLLLNICLKGIQFRKQLKQLAQDPFFQTEAGSFTNNFIMLNRYSFWFGTSSKFVKSFLLNFARRRHCFSLSFNPKWSFLIAFEY